MNEKGLFFDFTSVPARKLNIYVKSQIMKNINFPVFFTIILFTFCSGYEIKSSPILEDNLSAVYKGIPENGIFDRWLLMGPIPVFKNKQNNENQAAQKEAFNTDYILPSSVSRGIKEEKHFIGNSSYRWQFVQADDGIFDLTKTIGDTAFAITYAYAQIDMPEEKKIILGVGSDDAVKIWINGNLIHSNWVARGLLIDSDLIHVKLKKGRNDILVKIQNRGNSWAFTCRVIMPVQYSQKLILNTQIGQIENVKQLLKSGADINALSDLGLTPLQTARIYGQNKLADFYLEQGADTTIQMPSKEKLVDAYFDNIKKDYPGAAVLISKDGKILYEKAYGFANQNEVPLKQTKFRIASVTSNLLFKF
jgi:hypothetical protein